MPRLGPAFEKTVFFLYGLNPKTSEPEGPLGTGVIVGYYDVTGPGILHLYAVTAAHVALSGASIISVNGQNGKSRFIELDPSDWIANLDREDIAMVDITELVNLTDGGDSISYLPPGIFADDRFFRQVEFGIGEDGFMIGLFSGHSGKSQNMIAARFGNVSLLADSEAPIKRTNPDNRTFETPCHVFDIHSRPGFSGSPVFVYRTPDSDLRELQMRAARKQMVLPSRGHRANSRVDERDGSEQVEVIELDPHNNRFLRLLGIHVAQFHDEVTIKKVHSNPGEKNDLKDGDTIRFPGSMTIVVPAWEILRLMDDDRFAAKRQERKQAARR